MIVWDSNTSIDKRVLAEALLEELRVRVERPRSFLSFDRRAWDPTKKKTTFGLGVATEETLTQIRRTVHNCNQRKMDTLACHKDADELALPMLGYNQSRPMDHSP